MLLLSAGALSLVCSRRGALGLTFALSSPAYAYDAIPTAATGADPGVERRRKEREQRVATLNAQVTPLLATVRNSQTAAEYDEAVTKLTVWIIGTGPPAPSVFFSATDKDIKQYISTGKALIQAGASQVAQNP